jgi:hypothetical protein
MVEKLPFLIPEDKVNLRLEDVPRFNNMHIGHIQRLYAEQVCLYMYMCVCLHECMAELRA